MATGTSYRQDGELDRIISNVSIEAFLDRENIDYRNTFGSSGEQHNIKECPVCGGNEWKVYINTESGLGNCFHGSCEKKFNKWSFISASTGLRGAELREYMEVLAKEMGYVPKKKTAPVQKKSDLILPESYALSILGKNLKYLENRGITADLAEYFHLRYSKDGKFKYQSNGKWIYQDYAKRIIIPIFDINGKLVSFQGRDITDNDEKKYLFPPGYASTGSHLYNIQNALGADRIVLNEGVFDVFATTAALGQDTSTAGIVSLGTFGKHLSYGSSEGSDQIGRLIELKNEGLREVTFMWDGETKALVDAVQASLKVLELGLKVRVALLPLGKDPNEVPPSVVRDAYWKAIAINKMSAAKILLNPGNFLK